MNNAAPLLDEEALGALNRTRPWMYLIGIFSIVLACLSLLAVVGGLIGLGINPERAHEILRRGIVALVVCVPSAIVQLGYAQALSRINESTGADLGEAVELACVRQRNLWIVNGLTCGMLTLVLVFTILHTVFG